MRSIHAMGRRALAAGAALLLALGALALAAETGAPEALFGEDFRERCAVRGEDAVPYSWAVAGGRLYAVMGAEKYGYPGTGEIYFYDLAGGDYGRLAQVRPRAYGGEGCWSARSEAEKRDQEGRVVQLVGATDSDTLYGFNPASGQLGPVDAGGVHWRETRLDTSLLVAWADALPRELSMPFVEGDALYGYAAPGMFDAAQAAPEGMLLAFDLTTGACTAVSLPDTYALCPYTPGKALLLRRMESGRLYLSVFDLGTLSIAQEAFRKLPIAAAGTGWFDVCLDTADVGGLAYRAATDTILVLGKAGLWRSEGDGSFALAPVEWPEHFFGGTVLDWLSFRQSWALPDGTWIWGTERVTDAEGEQR